MRWIQICVITAKNHFSFYFPIFLTFVVQSLTMKYFFLCLLFCNSFLVAQVVNKTDSNRVKPQDTLVIDSGRKDSLQIFKPTIYDYQYQTQFSEKKLFDTVLSHDKTYIFSQYNNRDNFG